MTHREKLGLTVLTLLLLAILAIMYSDKRMQTGSNYPEKPSLAGQLSASDTIRIQHEPDSIPNVLDPNFETPTRTHNKDIRSRKKQERTATATKDRTSPLEHPVSGKKDDR